VRSLQRTSVALALAFVLLGSLVSLAVSPSARAESTTIEITDVYNAITPADEWFQLYNMTKGQLTLTGWSVCTSEACITLPTTTIESFSLAKIKASSLTGWPAKGLDGANDMLGIKDQSGKPIDSVNWGAPVSTWKNYEAFREMLWNPGVKAPSPTSNQSFFRMAIGKDADKPADWLTTASPPTGGQPTAVPATTVPGQPTAVPAPTRTPLTDTKGGTSTIDKTGGEFPVALALGLIVAVFAVRYFRRSMVPQKETE
jgi:hypothetical protein